MSPVRHYYTETTFIKTEQPKGGAPVIANSGTAVKVLADRETIAVHSSSRQSFTSEHSRVAAVKELWWACRPAATTDSN